MQTNTTNPAARVAAIREALALCTKAADKKMPETIAGVEEFREYVAAALKGASASLGSLDPSDYSATLGATTTPAEFREALEGASLDYARREVLRQAAGGNLLARVDGLITARVDEAMPTITARLAPVFSEAAQRLQEAAPSLPAGQHALDPGAVLRADAGDPYRIASDALTAMTTIAAIWPTDRHADVRRGLPRVLLPLLPYLAVDDTEPQRITWQGVPTSSQHPTTGSLGRLHSHIAGHDRSEPDGWDVQRALLELARGTWPGLTLELAADHAEMTGRAARIKLAFRQVTTAEGAKVGSALVR